MSNACSRNIAQCLFSDGKQEQQESSSRTHGSPAASGSQSCLWCRFGRKRLRQAIQVPISVFYKIFHSYIFCSNADGEVITRRRSCTDILCLLIFVAFLLAWAGLGVFALSKGDISRWVFLQFIQLPLLHRTICLSYTMSHGLP